MYAQAVEALSLRSAPRSALLLQGGCDPLDSLSPRGLTKRVMACIMEVSQRKGGRQMYIVRLLLAIIDEWAKEKRTADEILSGLRNALVNSLRR